MRCLAYTVLTVFKTSHVRPEHARLFAHRSHRYPTQQLTTPTSSRKPHQTSRPRIRFNIQVTASVQVCETLGPFGWCWLAMSLQINKIAHRPRVFWATPTLNTDPPTSSNGQTLQALRGHLVHGFRKVLWLVGDGIILFLCKKEWFSWRFSLLRGPTALQTEQFITKTDQTSWEPWKRYVQSAGEVHRPAVD